MSDFHQTTTTPLFNVNVCIRALVGVFNRIALQQRSLCVNKASDKVKLDNGRLKVTSQAGSAGRQVWGPSR